MKHIIIFLISIHTTLVFGFDKKSSGTMPSTCVRVFETDYTSPTSSIETELSIAIRQSILYTKKILDLKFAAAGFLTENKSVYGEYVRLNEMKEDIESQKSLTQNLKDEFIEKSDALIISLNNIEESLARRIYQDLSNERSREISRHNIALNNLHKHWLNMKVAYYRSIAKWAPYENYLAELNKLESSLQDTLKRLAEIHQISGGILTDLSQELSRPITEGSEQQICKLIDDKLQALSKM